MQRFFLVDASSEYLSLFCYELRQREDGTYERMDSHTALFNNVDREQFFGNLNSLCVTKAAIEAPKMALKPADIPADVAEFQKSPQMQAEVEVGYDSWVGPVAEGNAAERCKATLTEEGSTYRCGGKVGHAEPHSNGDWEWSDNVDIVLGPLKQAFEEAIAEAKNVGDAGSTITDLVDKTLGCGALQRHLDSRGGCD